MTLGDKVAILMPFISSIHPTSSSSYASLFFHNGFNLHSYSQLANPMGFSENWVCIFVLCFCLFLQSWLHFCGCFVLLPQAETSEDLYGWKTALENALAQAPSTSLVMGQNGIFQDDQADGADGSLEQCQYSSFLVDISVLCAYVVWFLHLNFCIAQKT